MLTIGELADLAGTTVRAIRHYHAAGGPGPAALSGELRPLLDAFDDELAEQERQIAVRCERIAELYESTVDRTSNASTRCRPRTACGPT